MRVTTSSAADGIALLVHPAGPERRLDVWARQHAEWIDVALVRHGAVLFRGFEVDSAAGFKAASTVMCRVPLDYLYRSTPRTSVEKHVYTATEYPPAQSIPLHNENAFQRDWPMRLAFCCLQPATRGGETPLARTSTVTKKLDPAMVSKFAELGVMYVRNYGQGVDLPWQTTFQTESRSEVDEYCRRQGIECQWLDDDCLRTRQACQGVARHPVTHETLWFNQAHLFHPSSLGTESHNLLLEVFGQANLPRNALYGNGEELEPGVLTQIREAYEAESRTFQWQRGDVLLLDNMLVAHGRSPFQGPRQVLVAMGDPFSSCSSATPNG
jgi:alpha-ketoglutarate-dependent taurine dioxygenase